MRQAYGGPKLPVELRNQFDPANNQRKSGGRNGTPSRKDRRKADRVEKKRQNKQVRRPVPGKFESGKGQARKQDAYVNDDGDGDDDDDNGDEDEEIIDWDNVSEDTPPPSVLVKESQKPLKSILKKVSPEEDEKEASVKIPRAIKEKLSQDDAEIAALEKRLGLKGKKKSKGVDNDGLDDIFGDLGDFGSEDDGLDQQATKRKRGEDDDWLASKRQKALGAALKDDRHSENDEQSEVSEMSSSEEDCEDESDLDDLEGSDLEDFGSDEDEGDTQIEDEQPTQPRVRENPYTAPVASGATHTAKYIPPALRAPPSSDAEALSRLRRQIQGLFNRLSEANILSILRDIEAIYQNNPRGYVNTTLVDLFIGMLSDPSALLDTFLNLHAGFIAAIYKVIGPDFGAQIIERIVSEFDAHYQNNKEGTGQQTKNLVSVIAELYTFQVIGSNIVFDYIRFFLEELIEINTELLLRIVRSAGPQLRQDDPTSLKDIVILLQKSVAKVGQDNLSIRTKFMIETINDLKNNKMKTGVAASKMSREHTTRMKKQLGTLSSRNLKATEPLRVGLKDIRETDKKGKWWLVGASWRNEPDNVKQVEPTGKTQQTVTALDNDGDDSEVDLVQLAREQRMNTDIRRAIYISIMSASDFKDAQVRLSKLNLKRSQEVEIPRVIVHCAGAEQTYNPYYTVLARKICSDHKSRKSFQFALWDIFKSLGEKQDEAEEAEDEDETSSDTSLRKLVSQGKLYGTLIGRKALPIASLKNLNFPYLQPKTKTLVEVILVTSILESLKSSKDKRDERAVREVFVEVDQAPEMIAGLQFFLKKTVRKTDIVEKAERETVRWACTSIMGMLTRILATTTMQEE